MVRSDADGPRALCLGCGRGLWSSALRFKVKEILRVENVSRARTTSSGAPVVEGCGIRRAEAWLRTRACRPSAPVCGLCGRARGGAKVGKWLRILHCGCSSLVDGPWPVAVWRSQVFISSVYLANTGAQQYCSATKM
jgi:hypothetical protein